MSEEAKKIKKAVIREDLLSITDCFQEAIVLNQFIYWSERIKDADEFIKKENEIAKSNGEEEREPFYGWIYKSSDELADEVMLGISSTQIRRYIKKLVEKKYIIERNNPKYKWDRKLQYKVNLVNIARALKEKGYPLNGYKIDLPKEDKPDEETILHPCTINSEPMNKQSLQNERAIAENTNINYNNRDYSTENTGVNNIVNCNNTSNEKVKSFSKENGKVKSSFSEKKHGARENSRKKTYFELLELQKDMLNKIKDISKQQFEMSNDEANTMAGIIEYFFDGYKHKTGKIHPILSDNTLYECISNIYYLSDEEYHHYDNLLSENPEAFIYMINDYFSCNYGKYKGGTTDYHLPHFATAGVLNALAQRNYAMEDYQSD